MHKPLLIFQFKDHCFTWFCVWFESCILRCVPQRSSKSRSGWPGGSMSKPAGKCESTRLRRKLCVIGSIKWSLKDTANLIRRMSTSPPEMQIRIIFQIINQCHAAALLKGRPFYFSSLFSVGFNSWVCALSVIFLNAFNMVYRTNIKLTASQLQENYSGPGFGSLPASSGAPGDAVGWLQNKIEPKSQLSLSASKYAFSIFCASQWNDRTVKLAASDI